MRHKYPRTYHLPWSLGATDDDKMLASVDHFKGCEIVVTEKLDGENTSMYRDHIHARSIDSKHHPSRVWVKALHGRIKHEIPEGWRICGENMYAKHSIHYRFLPSYFFVFAVYNEQNVCLSWDDTLEICGILGLETVPVLYRGQWDQGVVKSCWTARSYFSDEGRRFDPQEGYVVRVAAAFPYDQHADKTAKFVRTDHVQTSEHWMQEEVVPNLLRTV